MILYRMLLVLAMLLALIILAGTIYALAFRPKQAAVSSPFTPPASFGLESSGASIFTGLGRLRCPTARNPAGSDPGMVILQAAFPYHPGDKPFSEELASRIREFRSITTAYFAGQTVEELDRKTEENIKTELLSRYNAVLRLGQIGTLYFNEYMIIE